MTFKNNSKTTSLLLAGLATGAAAWYLFGTSNGKRAISRFSSSFCDLSDSIMSKANDTMDNLKSRAEDYTS